MSVLCELAYIQTPHLSCETGCSSLLHCLVCCVPILRHLRAAPSKRDLKHTAQQSTAYNCDVGAANIRWAVSPLPINGCCCIQYCVRCTVCCSACNTTLQGTVLAIVRDSGSTKYKPSLAYFAVQEARLQQLSMDLRSDLNSCSLTQLKDMVSDFMQQLKDSMARQALMQRQTQGQTGHSMAPGLQPEPLPNLDAETTHSSSHPQRFSTKQLQLHSMQGVSPLHPSTEGSPRSRQEQAENMQLHTHSRTGSVMTESEIELDLAESQASSEIEEEAAASGAHHAATVESVAESVSDYQYSMDFESSIHRSPLSGFRSPTPGKPTVDCWHVWLLLVYVFLYAWLSTS